MLRTARALIEAKIPAKRIRRSLESLRRELPESRAAVGPGHQRARRARRGARRRVTRWQAESGQYVLGLDVTLENGVLHVVERARASAGGAPQPGRGLVRRRRSRSRPATRARRWPPTAAPSAADARATAPPGSTGGACCTRRGRRRKPRRSTSGRCQRAGRRRAAAVQPGVLLEDLGDAGAALEAYQTRAARRIRIWPTATTTWRGCTSPWASRSMPSATSGSTGAWSGSDSR